MLHHLSMLKASQQEDKMGVEQARQEAQAARKTSVKVGPWDVCKKVFSQEDHRSMSFIDKSDLYFYDYNLAGLFVQENYLAAKVGLYLILCPARTSRLFLFNFYVQQ